MRLQGALVVGWLACSSQVASANQESGLPPSSTSPEQIAAVEDEPRLIVDLGFAVGGKIQHGPYQSSAGRLFLEFGGTTPLRNSPWSLGGAAFLALSSQFEFGIVGRASYLLPSGAHWRLGAGLAWPREDEDNNLDSIEISNSGRETALTLRAGREIGWGLAVDLEIRQRLFDVRDDNLTDGTDTLMLVRLSSIKPLRSAGIVGAGLVGIALMAVAYSGEERIR